MKIRTARWAEAERIDSIQPPRRVQYDSNLLGVHVNEQRLTGISEEPGGLTDYPNVLHLHVCSLW